MLQKQPTNAILIKIPGRTNLISALKTCIITFLIAIIGFIWGRVFLQKWTSISTPTIEPTTPRRDWYVIFEHKFPANFWAEGVHSFMFNANCPFGVNSTSENGPTNAFSVDRTAKIQISTVFIRKRGLYLTEIKGDSFGHFVHPSQETAAIYSLFALSFEDAKRLKDECKVSIKIDNSSGVDLSPTKMGTTQ